MFQDVKRGGGADRRTHASPSVHPARIAPPSQAVAYFRIGNHSHLLFAYGDRITGDAVAAMCDRLAGMLPDAAAITLTSADEFEIRSRQPVPPEGDAPNWAVWLQRVCEIVPLIPFESDRGPIHLWLSASLLVAASAGLATCDRWIFPFQGAPRGTGDWVERYRLDMAMTSRVLTALQASRGASILPYWQAVCHGNEEVDPLYFEAVARISSQDGLPEPMRPLILSLERTGFVPLFDLHMMRLVVAELERSPAIDLAVNISALSLDDDLGWMDMMSDLARKPDISRRLLIEITETASSPDISHAIRCINGFRERGCRVAIDNFGADHASVRQLLAFAPDVIKVDRTLLHCATQSTRDRALYIRLSQLAMEIAAVVVAEGVETPDQKQVAVEAGIIWQQGHFWGQASLARSWSFGRDGLKAGSLSRPLFERRLAETRFLQGSVR